MAGRDSPEIILLDDEDEVVSPSNKVEEPKATLPELTITEVTVPKSTPATSEPASSAASTSKETPKAPQKEAEVMEVDDDSDLELLEEVPASSARSVSRPSSPRSVLREVTVSSPTQLLKETDLEVTSTRVEVAEKTEEKKDPEPKKQKVVDIEDSDPEPPKAGVSTETPKTETDLKIEPVKVEKLKKQRCCNMDCNMKNKTFIEADLLAKNFYEVKNPEKICHVCETCSRAVDLYRQKCLDMLQLEQPIIDAIHFLPSKEMVILDDSDEEKSSDGEAEDDTKYDVDMDMLNDIVQQFQDKYKISMQEEKCKDYLLKQCKEVKDDMQELDESLIECNKMLDEVRGQLFDPWRPENTVVSSIDTEMLDGHDPYGPKKRAVAMKKVTPVPHRMQQQVSIDYPNTLPDVIAEVPAPADETSGRNIPPKGPPRSSLPVAHDSVYAMKSGLYHEWLPARVSEVTMKNGDQHFKVKFSRTNTPNKTLVGRQLAYDEVAKYQYEVGTRVIAIFHNPEEIGLRRYLFYAGIIAEGMKVTNNYRYLIFFDDGCTQYVPHDQIRLIVKRSANVWEDCHPDIREFVRSYLDMYPENPMVRLAVNQKVKTEWNTRWWLTKVKEVDCSLVLVHFEADNRTEWIYRGSQRLAPLFCEMQKKQMQKTNKSAVRLHRGLASSAGRRNQPEIEYRRVLDDEEERQKVARAVAKKSTVNRPYNSVPSLPERKENYGETIIKPLGSGRWNKVFMMHQCNPRCIDESENTYKEGDRVNCNPMLIPLNQGWGRETTTFRNTKMQVFYRGPCGRRIRSMLELMRYLRVTKSTMPADLFTFDSALRIDSSFNVDKPLYSIKDISYGSENVKIPCVNTINHSEYPTYVNYSTLRTPSAKTYISDDPGFLVCCDCTDDCQDKSRCACHKLTVEEARVLDPKVDPTKVGYNYRRLAVGGQQIAAIYECNRHCKCQSTCLNRVVQHKMKFQLQLFKTEKRGWGLRALHDIPSGSFLCIYAGQIMTEQEGNDEGKQFGDEYLAELDYIEVLERCKEGYESDVTDIEDADFDGSKCNDEESDESIEEPAGTAAADKDFLTSAGIPSTSDDKEKRMSLRKRDEMDKAADKKAANPDDEGIEDEMEIGEVKAPKGFKTDKAVSVRYHFDHSEDIYVMDAKSIGNLGRYFNHSCDPNVIVQNVFVDTHDLRFPWVAFFTKRHVPAGTELCWDYNYEIGSLPDRRLDCYCESYNCRGRLL